MRRNTPLSQYMRGHAFFDWRIFDVEDTGARSRARRKEETLRNLLQMEQWDMLVMDPLIQYGQTAYVEVPLEDKLTSIVNKFEAGKPIVSKPEVARVLASEWPSADESRSLIL